MDTIYQQVDNGAEQLKTEGGKIVGVIQIVGTVVSIVMMTVLGIKYILGSAEEKANYKESLKPYLIGAILIFAFSNMTQLIYEWARTI